MQSALFISLSSKALPELLLVEESLNLDRWSPQQLLNALQDGALNLGLQAQSKPALLMGFALTTQLVDELHILRLAVAAEFQGRGVATALIRCLLFWSSLQEIRTVWLEVRKSNQAAQRIYERMGFQVAYIRRSYYPSLDQGATREDALVMFRHVN